MNRIDPFVFLSIVLLFFSSLGLAQPSQVREARKYSDKELKADLASLRQIMTENHPGLYDFTPRATFDSLFKEQEKKVLTANTLAESFQIIGPLVARIGCSHSSLRLGNHWDDPGSMILPIKVVLTKDSCIVIESEDTRLIRGMSITRVNGKPIGKILQTIGTWISTDGSNASARLVRTQTEFSDWLAIHEGFCNEYRITYADGKSEKTVTVPTRHWAPPSYSQAGSLKLKLLPLSSTGILTIKTFAYYNRVERFREFVDSAFLALRNTKNLILDLRGNGGGDPWCSSYLLQHLIAKPFKYFEPISGNYEPLSKDLAPAKNLFAGKLVVLIDGGCSSSTGHLCALLKYHGVGRFVGRETGGTYTCNDNSGSFTLPSSGLTVRMARTKFTTSVEGIRRFEGIKPDIPVRVVSRDIIRNVDATLARALEFAKEK